MGGKYGPLVPDGSYLETSKAVEVTITANVKSNDGKSWQESRFSLTYTEEIGKTNK